MSQRTPQCSNMNHNRMNAPVKYCPSCGGVVNKNVTHRKCGATEHSARMKQREKFCVDCGIRLE